MDSKTQVSHRSGLLPDPTGHSHVQVLDVYGSDVAAVHAWLQSKPGASEHSIRSYSQAIKSLQQWLSDRRGGLAPNALITLKSSDAHAYLKDLLDARIGPKGSPLEASTVKHRMTVLSAMYSYWLLPRDGGDSIVRSNPFHGLSVQVSVTQPGNTGANRALSQEEQSVVETTIGKLPVATSNQRKHHHRARLIWILASRLALRRAEIADLRVNDFKRSSAGWKIEVYGKGRKANQKPDVVMVPEVVMDEIRSYLKAFGHHPEPLPSNSNHLIQHVNQRGVASKMSETHVARIMKEVFRMAADYAEGELRMSHVAERLRQASTHWGRHTWFMNTLKEHDIELVSRAGRHRDIRTTMKSYVGTSEEDLAKAMCSAKPIRAS